MTSTVKTLKRIMPTNIDLSGFHAGKNDSS